MTTPTISGVTGTVETGQTLTITGTNMVNEDKTNWNSAFINGEDGFEGANATADGWGYGGGSQNYETSIKLMGSQSQGWTASDATGNPGNQFYKNSISGNIDYLRWYTRNDVSVGDGTWCTNYQKIFNNYPSPDPTISINLNFIGDNDVGAAYNTVALLLDSVTQASANLTSVLDGPMRSAKWYCMEMYLQNTTPWNCKVWMNGVLIIDHDIGSSHGSDLASATWDLNRAGTNSGYGCKVNWDGVVVATSRIYPASKIEIGDSATYASATKVYQYPETLSDTSNIVTCDLTGLTGGDYYLFVTNGRNETSAAYSLSGGGGGGSSQKGSTFGYFR